MNVGILKESFPQENRVALVPAHVKNLENAGYQVVIERGAGVLAGFTDSDYEAAGVDLLETRPDVISHADILLQVRAFGANPEQSRPDLQAISDDKIVIGLNDPLTEFEMMAEVARQPVTLFALELLPRITRAQSMDVLSSMAMIAGYKSVLIAANELPKMFPMMMTAAGTVTPAKVLVIGAGVAGLQAIATAKRLGAVVHAYDIRTAVKEQVESLGAKFVELEIESGEAESSGGYAKAMDEDFYKRQQELMAKVVSESDVVITTAAVPGKRAPILVTKGMIEGMKPGSLLVDLAAERGGNSELTQPGSNVDVNGVRVMGPLNLPSTIPNHASQLYSKNITTYLLNMTHESGFEIDTSDEIVRETLVIRGGEVVHPAVRKLLSLDIPEESRTE